MEVQVAWVVRLIRKEAKGLSVLGEIHVLNMRIQDLRLPVDHATELSPHYCKQDHHNDHGQGGTFHCLVGVLVLVGKVDLVPKDVELPETRLDCGPSVYFRKLAICDLPH